MADPRAGASSVRDLAERVDDALSGLSVIVLRDPDADIGRVRKARQVLREVAALLAAPPAPRHEQEPEDATRVDGERRAAGPTGSTAASNEAGRGTESD